MNLSLFFVISLIVPLYAITAPLTSYLKKIPNKTCEHNLKGIDFIYMINLDERPEKYQQSLEELLLYGIIPYRFSAVNGWNLSLEALQDLGVKFSSKMKGGFMGTCYLPSNERREHHEKIECIGRTYFCLNMSRGAIGIVLSHLSILQDAYDSGYETIWVMEDDIEVIKDPHLISERIRELDAIIGRENWDILFTDPDTKNNKGEYVPVLHGAKRPNFFPEKKNFYKKRSYISHNLRQVGGRYGAYSMIINRSGMGKILKFIKIYKIFLPYDIDMYLIPGIKLYTTTEDIVSTKIDALTDNGHPGYLSPIK